MKRVSFFFVFLLFYSVCFCQCDKTGEYVSKEQLYMVLDGDKRSHKKLLISVVMDAGFLLIRKSKRMLTIPTYRFGNCKLTGDGGCACFLFDVKDTASTIAIGMVVFKADEIKIAEIGKGVLFYYIKAFWLSGKERRKQKRLLRHGLTKFSKKKGAIRM